MSDEPKKPTPIDRLEASRTKRDRVARAAQVFPMLGDNLPVYLQEGERPEFQRGGVVEGPLTVLDPGLVATTSPSGVTRVAELEDGEDLVDVAAAIKRGERGEPVAAWDGELEDDDGGDPWEDLGGSG